MTDEVYKPIQNAFWMVWREGTPTTRYRHWSKREAVVEAERLARMCPGEPFFVLKTTAAVMAEPGAVKWLELVKDDIPF